MDQVEIIVSDHAVIRYLERVKGFDIKSLRKEIDSSAVGDHEIIQHLENVMHINIEAIRKGITTEKLVTQVSTIGDCKYPIGDGFLAIIRENTIVTIKP